jgi:hypothetical protein
MFCRFALGASRCIWRSTRASPCQATRDEAAGSLAQCKPATARKHPRRLCVSRRVSREVCAFFTTTSRSEWRSARIGLVPCNQQCRTYDPIADVTLLGMWFLSMHSEHRRRDGIGTGSCLTGSDLLQYGFSWHQWATARRTGQVHSPWHGPCMRTTSLYAWSMGQWLGQQTLRTVCILSNRSGALSDKLWGSSEANSTSVAMASAMTTTHLPALANMDNSSSNRAFSTTD